MSAMKMMNKRGIMMGAMSVMCLFAFFVSTVAVGEEPPTILKGITIRIVDDGDEWPPYSYYERVDGKPTKKVIGFSIDVITEIFSTYDLTYTVELLPWKRALNELETGENYDMVLSATITPERLEKFYLSEPYYETHEHIYYSKTRYPNGPEVASKADLKKFKPIFLRGSNWGNFGYTDEEVHEVSTQQQIFMMLAAERAELTCTSFELIQGKLRVDPTFIIDPVIAHQPIPDFPTSKFHMMFTKNEKGKALKEIVDQGIAEMKANGKLVEYLKAYGLFTE